MHELGIAARLVEVALQRSVGKSVRRIVVEAGVLTAVLPDALQFAFEVVASETKLRGAQLVIETPAARAVCNVCGRECRPDRVIHRCVCDSFDLKWLTGHDLLIKEIEVMECVEPADAPSPAEGCSSDPMRDARA